VGFVVWALNQQLPELPSTPRTIAATLLAVGAYMLATLWMCERWATLLWRVDRGLPREEAYWSGVLGLLGNAFLPVRAGDAIRVGLVSTTREKVSARSSVGMLVAERALDVGCHVVLLVVVFLGLYGPSTGGPLGRVPVVAAGLALLAVGTVAMFYFGGTVMSRWRPSGRIAVFLAPILAPLIGLRRGSAKLIGLSVGIWLAEIVGWWAAAQAVDLHLNLLQAAYVFAIASIALVAPIGFGAIGTLDAAIVFSVKAVGVSTTEILGFVLLLRIAFVLPSVLLAAVLWLRRWLKSRAIRVAAASAVDM
jgi:uncharacterized membrane protein YbhN (UPF0104 family)